MLPGQKRMVRVTLVIKTTSILMWSTVLFVAIKSRIPHSVHDSQVLGALLDEQNEGEEVWAHSAYGSESIEWILQILQFLSHIHERAYGNHRLIAKHKEDNREHSQVRGKVEHVFGHWVNEMGGKLMGSIGKQSVKATIGVKNLVYNFKRYVFWENQNPKAVG